MELPPLSDTQIKTYREAFSRFDNSAKKSFRRPVDRSAIEYPRVSIQSSSQGI